MTEKQQRIINLLKENGAMKKADIVDVFEHEYYFNASKHVGECLSRLRKKGVVKKIKHGHYTLGNENPIPNQTTLF